MFLKKNIYILVTFLAEIDSKGQKVKHIFNKPASFKPVMKSLAAGGTG